MPLRWSEARSPNAKCSYDHVASNTPLGTLYIEWKSWKDTPSPICVLPWGDIIGGNTVEETKQLAQSAWNAMCLKVAEYSQTNSDDRASDSTSAEVA